MRVRARVGRSGIRYPHASWSGVGCATEPFGRQEVARERALFLLSTTADLGYDVKCTSSSHCLAFKSSLVTAFITCLPLPTSLRRRRSEWGGDLGIPYWPISRRLQKQDQMQP